MSAEAIRAAAIVAESWLGRPAGRPAAIVAEPAEVVAILRRNKVPLLGVDPGGGRLAASGVWAEAIALESAAKEDLLAEYRLVEECLDGAGITPVLFKSPRGLPYRSSNLDLLVRPAELARAATLLEEMGHIRLPHYREEHKLLFRRFRGGRSVICVHLHEAISWGRVTILEGDDVIDRSRPSPEGECRVAAPEDLLLATLAHSLYETDQVRLSDLRAIRSASAEPSLDWEEAVSRVRRQGWTAGFSSILLLVEALERSLYGASCIPGEITREARQTLDGAVWARRYVRRATARLERGEVPAIPMRISRIYSKLHYTERLLSQPGRSPDERADDLIATLGSLAANRLRWRCRPAAIVSLSGIDGAGKSAAGRVLLEALSLCEVPARGVWSRGGFSAPVEAVKRASRAAMPSALPGPGDPEAKRRWLAGRAAGSAFALLVGAEQAISHLLRVLLPRRAGLTLVCDRYAYDTAAEIEVKTGGGLASRVGAVLIGFVRRPDLALLLRVPVGEAVRRKPDEERRRLELQDDRLRRLARRHGLVEVDAGRPRDQVAGEVVDRALRAIFARWR